jgi:hypothetical protein
VCVLIPYWSRWVIDLGHEDKHVVPSQPGFKSGDYGTGTPEASVADYWYHAGKRG